MRERADINRLTKTSIERNGLESARRIGGRFIGERAKALPFHLKRHARGGVSILLRNPHARLNEPITQIRLIKGGILGDHLVEVGHIRLRK